ncbi:MAG: gliding motility-associated C-terminal domain-containing protein, partial [Saprospiraceae bacterium]|nr:gliding motility-associated C-terminal domain-containing protein [Saprospiraceae bacterium]
TQSGIAINGGPTNGIISGNTIEENGGSGVSILGGTVLISQNSINCNFAGGITRPSPPNIPVVTQASTQTIKGVSTPNTAIEVFVFSDAGCAGVPVQGKTFVGNTTSLATGEWTLTVNPGSVNAGDMVTATSTENNNNTSAFSPAVTVIDCSGFVTDIDHSDIACNGDNNGSAMAIPDNTAFDYSWSHGPITPSVFNLAAGTYTVTITNTDGCTSTQSTDILEPLVLSVFIATDNAPCSGGGNNGSITAMPDGGTPNYNYAWSTGDMVPAITGLAAGTYTATVTDQNNCTSAQVLILSEAPALSLSVTPVPIPCFGTNTGSATANAGGGTPGFAYAWSDGQMSGMATGLSAGTYTVTVTDVNTCSITSSINITQSPELVLNVSFTGESMAGAGDGTASATASGGNGPYSYNWSNGEMIRVITGLSPGTYTVTVTDALNCTKTSSVVVTIGGSGGGCSALPVYAVLVPDEVCGNTEFTLVADDLYPNPVVNYVWQFPNGDSALTSQATLTIMANSSAFSGEYFVLRDSAGCRSIPVGGAPVTVLTVDNVSAGTGAVNCSAVPVQLNASIPGAGTGSWVSLGAASVANPAQNQTMANNLQNGANLFVWQVALGDCVQAATDTVIFFVESKANAGDDHYVLQYALDIAVMEVLLNDDLKGLTDTVVQQIGAPSSGILELLSETNRFRYTVDENFRGTVSFQYTVCNPSTVCNIPCDTATVTIEVQNLPKVPTGLVVNDPGLNGALTIKGLSGFSKAEINIFDRWGDLVFLDDDYKNTDPWQGDYRRSGQYLPGGAYYYFLKVYAGAEQIGKTITGVIHLFE